MTEKTEDRKMAKAALRKYPVAKPREIPLSRQWLRKKLGGFSKKGSVYWRHPTKDLLTWSYQCNTRPQTGSSLEAELLRNEKTAEHHAGRFL